MDKKAILVGASGLIGSNLLQILLDEPYYSEVLVISRKELSLTHKKLVQLIVDFNQLDKHAGAITGHTLFCCLGTTNKQTPDKAEYRKIDHDYPVMLAQMAHQNKMPQCHLVSAVGANAGSSVFYTRLKGETERDLMKIGLPALHIYRPSMLLGRKKNTRAGERIIAGIMRVIDPLLLGGLKKYHSVPGAAVARAMFKQSIDNETGTFVYHYNEIKQYS